MDQEDPETRIADLERQLAEQKRIAELERQLADAKRAAEQAGFPQSAPPPTPGPPPPSQSGPAMRWKGAWVSVDGGGFQQVGIPGADAIPPPQAMERLAEIMSQAGFGGQAGFASQSGFPAPPIDRRLAAAPRRIPAAFWLAELLPCGPVRWIYYAILVVLGVTVFFASGGSTLTPVAISSVIVLTLAGIYAYQFSATGKRFALLRWGEVANVLGTQILSTPVSVPGSGTSGTSGNYWPPVVHGWKVERPWSSRPDYKTLIRYTLNSYQGDVKVWVREYHDGVVLADPRKPARALCVTSFAYDLDRDESGNWIGRIGPRLMVRMAIWLIIVVCYVAAAAAIPYLISR